MRPCVLALACLLFSAVTAAQPADESADDLVALETQLIAAIERAAPATVAIHLGQGTGSGVIVSPDGLILSVAHVTGSPGQRAAVYFADGSVAAAETLGLEPGTDCGMLRLLGGGPWPFIDLSITNENHDGPAAPHVNAQPTLHTPLHTPVLALGHPGGFDPARPVHARLGSILHIDDPASGGDGTLRTDAALTAGDSGGPLLNPAGQLIAIHARVGPTLDANYHIPLSRFLEQWNKLLQGGRTPAALGAVGRDALNGFIIGAVEPDSPAHAAGLTPGDLIVGFNGVALGTSRTLRSFLALRQPGDDVQLRILRRGQPLNLTVTLTQP